MALEYEQFSAPLIKSVQQLTWIVIGLGGIVVLLIIWNFQVSVRLRRLEKETRRAA